MLSHSICTPEEGMKKSYLNSCSIAITIVHINAILNLTTCSLIEMLTYEHLNHKVF